MKTHRLDPISLLFGIAVVVVGIAAINARLGNLVNHRPDAVLPLLVLMAGVVAVAVAARRSFEDVDSASNDQDDGSE